MSVSIGIDQIHFYTANYYLDLAVLAEKQKIDPDKYYKGLGQEKMAVPSVDEDIVTMAANAALPLVKNNDLSNLDSLLLATETGIDQSKSAGVYVHSLLNLPANCRVVELKQACYSATAAVQMATALVARQPHKKVLVIATDMARYDLGTPGEATQGCGAVALLISAKPRLLELAPETGKHTEDVMDFWRPNYRRTALVDGKYSTKVYMSALQQAWLDFSQQTDTELTEFKHFCYHLPFSRMGEKAHQFLAKENALDVTEDQLNQQLSASSYYNRQIGNSYTASLYIGLASLLETTEQDLSSAKIALFSYGSGAVAEFFSGQVQPNYKAHLYQQAHTDLLANRTAISYEQYLALHANSEPEDGSDVTLPKQSTGAFRLAGFSEHKRLYRAN